jgi:hypothetical protein
MAGNFPKTTSRSASSALDLQCPGIVGLLSETLRESRYPGCAAQHNRTHAVQETETDLDDLVALLLEM